MHVHNEPLPEQLDQWLILGQSSNTKYHTLAALKVLQFKNISLACKWMLQHVNASHARCHAA